MNRIAYQNFFLKTEEGKEFIAELERLIAQCHENAEKNADQARDSTQQARGVRMALDHIRSVTTELKKGKP